MQTEEPTIIQSLENHLAEYGHTTVGQDIAAAILVIKDFHQKAALAAQVQDVAGWQPIETAPKDGRTILAYFPLEGLGKDWERVMPVKYRESMMPEPWIFAGRAASSYSTGPTHWMPLPAAPAKQEGGHVTSK